MNIAITGASGLVGNPLAAQLRTLGHVVRKVIRGNVGSSSEIAWNPESGTIEIDAMQGVDVLFHLAGENIAGKRWSKAVKQKIRDSRVKATRLLCQSLAKMPRKPATLICASAIGFYGDQGDMILDESAACGSGFLPEVCREWEEATAPAREAGIRVVNVRIGIVLSEKGGALAKMLPPFKMGAGGILGNGKQYMSWISLDDLVSVLIYCMENSALSGVVNATTPNPVTNHEFTKTLGKVLRRPTIFPLPTFMARLLFGEMADALLLASARVVPAKLQAAGFVFQDKELPICLERILKMA